MRKKLILAIVIMGCFNTVLAQNVNNSLIWTVREMEDLGTSHRTAYYCTFVTNGNQPIVWSQKNGAYVTTLCIESVVT